MVLETNTVSLAKQYIVLALPFVISNALLMLLIPDIVATDASTHTNSTPT